MLPRTQLIQLQRALFDRLESSSRQLFGPQSPELKRYYTEYHKDFATYQKYVTRRDLLLRVLSSQIVFCGDYHTLSQAQRTVVRLLGDASKHLKRQKRQVVLALEMLNEADVRIVNRFLRGDISEKALIQKTRFRSHWGFQWENYRELFHLAKKAGITVMGLAPKDLNTKLAVRDRYAASKIAEMTEHDPGALVFVLIGDLHLASNHLPLDLKNCLKKRHLKRSALTIHQNLDKFYWDLVEQGAERFVEVIQVKKDVYCVMNSTPWVKLKCHLKWMETLSEGAEPKNTIRDFERALDTLDHSHEIREVLDILKVFFEFQENIPDTFHIRGPLDLDFLNDLTNKKRFKKSEVRILTECLETFDSQFFPRTNEIFLTSLNPNHVSSQAAYFLHSILSGYQGVFTNPRRDFYTFVWIESLAFLSSKIFNPKRKCSGWLDLKRQLRRLRLEREGKKALAKAIQFALIHLEQERKLFAGHRKKLNIRIPESSAKVENVLIYYRAAKLLGMLLGQALYSALIENRVGKDEIRALFYCPWTITHQPKRRYLEWLIRLEPFQYRDVVKTEKM